MRHSATLLASLEGMSRPTYRIARELANNSRSGLTVRFLSKKLEAPQEEIEYLLDLSARLFFLDLTKIKLVPEGHHAVKRITEGLENRGDADSLFQHVKRLSAHEFRVLEERIGLAQPSTKKLAVEALLGRHYAHPDALVSYVATRGFSDAAHEVFDVLWQSKDGVLPVSQVRIAHGGTEGTVEEALLELFRGFALFEMFRFDSEDRLVRVSGLLSELRQFRESNQRRKKSKAKLKTLRGKPDTVRNPGLELSDTICKLVAAIAAKPARIRGDGDLFREDRRRLAEICPEEADPSLNTCLWAAEGAGWLARVDNTLRAGALDVIIGINRIQRHKVLADWFLGHGDEQASRRLLASLAEQMKPGAWYPVIEFIHYAVAASAEEEQPLLKRSGGHWEYVSPSASGQTEARLARSLEESLFWLGIVERGQAEIGSVFRLTTLGCVLLGRAGADTLAGKYPPRKGEFVVQPNFDIVVPTQDMDPLLTVPLDQFAVRTSSGQATVYNVTKDSFTQAVQDGHDANGFIGFLLKHNRGGSLPANVMQTLEDWRGGMKRVRLRTIHILESDDNLVMADLMHRRRFKKYFKPLDPQAVVQYGNCTKAELARELEKDGFVVD